MSDVSSPSANEIKEEKAALCMRTTPHYFHSSSLFYKVGDYPYKELKAQSSEVLKS
jgi:hypothetical protein